MPRCDRCNADVPRGSGFCPRCGAAIDDGLGRREQRRRVIAAVLVGLGAIAAIVLFLLRH